MHADSATAVPPAVDSPPSRIRGRADSSSGPLPEAGLRAMMEQMPAVAWSVDLNLRFTSGVGAGLALLGLKPGDILGASLYEYFGTRDPAFLPIAAHLDALRGENATYEVDWQGRTFHSHVEPLREPDGTIVGVIGLALDITDRKQVEHELQESQRQFQLLAENVPGVIYLCKNDARYTMLYLNDAVDALTGYPKEQFLQDRISFTELFHPEDAANIFSTVDQALAVRRPFHLVYRLRHQSGAWRWVEEFGGGVYGPDGSLRYLEGFLSDITQRRSAEEALKESEDRYRRLVEVCPDAILIHKDNRIVFMNPTGLALIGADSAEQVLGRSPIELVHPDYHAVVRERIRSILEEGRRTPLIEIQLVKLDGTPVDVEVTAGPFLDKGETAVQVYFRDIRARKHTTQALDALSRRLVEVQEAERRHVARELHDEIGQNLTGLRLILENMDRLQRAGDPAAGEKLADAQELVNRLVGQVRTMSLQLRPGMLDDLGLLPALLWLFNRYQEQTGIEIRFTHFGLNERLHPEVETAAFRIMQEALTNVARHAQTSLVSVHLWRRGQTLCFQVEDEGKGFDVERQQGAPVTAGLAGMMERARLLGGRVTVDSQPGAGTRIAAELPLTGNAIDPR